MTFKITGARAVRLLWAAAALILAAKDGVELFEMAAAALDRAFG